MLSDLVVFVKNLEMQMPDFGKSIGLFYINIKSDPRKSKEFQIYVIEPDQNAFIFAGFQPVVEFDPVYIRVPPNSTSQAK